MENTADLRLYAEDWIIKALNAWMDDYIENPDKYEADFQTVMRHLQEKNGGEEPSYGAISFELMCRLVEPSKRSAKLSKGVRQGVGDEVRT